ncbi:MAG: hypothetical protein E6Q97_25490 [Desulfurellales bacterium]|nr:MAG: hypothetical protein E6Q97_25490 [Desulfurellales bacterium]
MSSHDQAVQELMDEFGMTQAEAEQAADLEEVGFVMNEDGVILPDVDPDAPIDMSPFQGEDTVKWN